MKNFLVTITLFLILSFPIFSQSDGSVEFDAAKGQNINHGLFWKPGINHGVFFWEAWVKPYPNAQYVISDGYGGSHALLFGFSGGTTRLALAGNVSDASTGIVKDLGTAETVPVNQWCHIAVGWDGQRIVSFINGIPSGIVPYTGQRSTIVSSGSGVLFIGGSDHSNFNGKIARVRGFEGVLPMDSLLNSFTPETYFRSTYLRSDGQVVTAAFLADYSTSSKIYPDLSLGYQGANHPGILSKGVDIGFFGFKPNPTTDLPLWTNEAISPPVYTPPIIPIPAGVLVYDSFNRKDSSIAFGATGLGSADKSYNNSKARLKWNGAFVNQWGILGEKALNLSQTPNPVWLETGTPNMDVRGTRLIGSFASGNLELIYRYQNDNNYGRVYVSEGNVYLIEYVNGQIAMVRTGVQPQTFWLELKVVANGNQITVYCSGDQVISTTSTNLAAATKAGMHGLASSAERFDDFAVYAAN